MVGKLLAGIDDGVDNGGSLIRADAGSLFFFFSSFFPFWRLLCALLCQNVKMVRICHFFALHTWSRAWVSQLKDGTPESFLNWRGQEGDPSVLWRSSFSNFVGLGMGLDCPSGTEDLES